MFNYGLQSYRFNKLFIGFKIITGYLLIGTYYWIFLRHAFFGHVMYLRPKNILWYVIVTGLEFLWIGVEFLTFSQSEQFTYLAYMKAKFLY